MPEYIDDTSTDKLTRRWTERQADRLTDRLANKINGPTDCMSEQSGKDLIKTVSKTPGNGIADRRGEF